MSVVKINAIHVPAEAGAELEKRFAARATKRPVATGADLLEFEVVLDVQPAR